MTTLVEYWESGNAPHEALGRAARRLSNGGAIYLGGGVGIEKQRKGDADLYAVVDGAAKAQTYTGPLSAVIAAFSKSGSSTAPDSPGGATSITDPAAAARLRELKDEEAEARRDIDRMESRQRRRAKDASSVFMPGGLADDGWEARRVGELKSDLSRIAAERERLLATGNVEEVEQTRPGTNFTKIPAPNVAKLKGIIEHYKGMAHGFTACVRDQIKHGLSEDHANRRCAVVKDLGQRSTKWRKGGAGKVSEECEALLTAALGRVGVCVEQLGLASTVALVEGVAGDVPSFVETLAEGVRDDFVLLAMAGHPLALAAFGVEEEFDEGKVRRDFHGRFAAKIGALGKGASVTMNGVKVTHVGSPLAKYRVEDDGDHGSAAAAFSSSPKNAAQVAVGRSLASKDPKSIGGAKSYSSIADLPGNEGMAPRMKLPGSVKRPAAIASDSRERKAASMGGGIAPATQKGIAAQVVSLITSGMGQRQAISRIATNRGLTISQVADFYRRHGGAAVSESEGVLSGLLEAFSAGSKTAAPNAQRDAARRSGQPVRKPGQGGPPRAPGAGEFDESKHKRGSAGTSQGGKFVTKGSSGEDVRAVQHRVGASPDGKYGERTKRAVMEFQKRHGLQVDGIVGHQTAVALAGHDGKSAQAGELKGSDRAKLARLRKGGASLRARGRRARGGTVV